MLFYCQFCYYIIFEYILKNRNLKICASCTPFIARGRPAIEPLLIDQNKHIHIKKIERHTSDVQHYMFENRGGL